MLNGAILTSPTCQPAAARPDELDAELIRQVDLVIDAGACAGGLPSTVVAVTANGAIEVRRPGAVATSELARLIGYTPRLRVPSTGAKR